MRGSDSRPGRAVLSDLGFLAGISGALALRQVALLLVLPFISIYAQQLPGGTPALAGLAVGVYGLMQGVLQIPFGAWSDSFGRKRVVIIGTGLLFIGLLVAASARDVVWLIVGRAIQGSGAVNGAAYAWVADRTPAERLNRAMGVLATSIGLAAIASFVVGPLLYTILSLAQVFAVCAALVLLVGLYVVMVMTDERVRHTNTRASSGLWRSVVLWRLIGAGFFANYILNAVAFVAPLLLAETLGRDLWKALVPAAIIGVLVMRAVTVAADRGHLTRMVSLCSLAFLPTGGCLLLGGPLAVGLGTALFMAGYLSLSALLPPSVSRVAGPEARGTANGAYNSSAFLGSFAGGLLTGILWGIHPQLAVVAILAAWAIGQLLLIRLPSSLELSELASSPTGARP